MGAKLFGRALGGSEKGSLYDSYTGLKNGDMLQRDFAAMEDKSRHAMVLIYLDGFYRLNSLFGLKLGGETILKLCPYLEEFARKYKGDAYRPILDKFYLLVSVMDRQEFLKELRELFSQMEQMCVTDREAVYRDHYNFVYSVYFLSQEDNEIPDIRNLVNLMNLNISGLKGGGRTAGSVISEKPDWGLLGMLSTEVRSAWEQREFIPYYQLIYDLKDRKPAGAELLTRWRHPGRGIIMPKDFIVLLEREGLTAELDVYMLEEAGKRIKKWIDDELVTVPICVNISRLSLYRKGFADSVISAAEKYGLPPILINLEFSESSLLAEKTENVFQVLKKLHDYGFHISMDNVGEGQNSSINLLRDFPIDAMKLKPRFFDGAERSERARLFVTRSIAMAKEMGVQIIGTDIETEAQAELCRQMGCELGQGFYFSKPESQEEFENEIF